MPTSGITLTNVNSYLELPNVFCCSGSWIVPQKALDGGQFRTYSGECPSGGRANKLLKPFE